VVGAHDYPAIFSRFHHARAQSLHQCGGCVRICRMEVGSSCYDNMGPATTRSSRRPTTCSANGRLRELRQVRRDLSDGSIELNPASLTGTTSTKVAACSAANASRSAPTTPLEQTDFFELASFDRKELAGESLFARDGQVVDPLRETVPT